MMVINTQRVFLLAVALLFCLFGCDSGSDDLLLPNNTPSEIGQLPAVGSGEVTDAEVSFEQDLLPILTARCAFAGCHVAGGPEGIDLSTYQAFMRGGDDHSIFTPENARSSDIVEEIVSGRMPPGGPPLSDAEIQLFVDWINQQEPQGGIVGRDGDDNDDEDDDDDDDHDHDDHDDDDDDDDDHDHDD